VSGPLEGLRVVELAGLGPCPFAGMVLADLGADVLRVERPSAVAHAEPTGPSWDLLERGKRSIGVDLKHAAGVALLLELAQRADVLLEGFRPGVVERLGVGPDACRARNPRLVYGRMTGWGQSGPLATSAGHDIDYIALAGALDPIGRAGERPVPPMNLIGDFGGGGLLLALGVVSAVLAAQRSGEGQVVDAAMVDGAALLMTMIWSLRALGEWKDERGTNLLDTGAPFYEVYECADGRHVAVGAIEPEFYGALLEVMGLSAGELPPQMDRERWPATKKRFAEVFRTKTREEWVVRAAGSDACLAPVLEMSEVSDDPHNTARGTFVDIGGTVQPGPAPRFDKTPAAVPSPPVWPGGRGAEALEAWGLGHSHVAALCEQGVLRMF
jgi:alpha-methylacyl-CoA racemase